jgi:hypothetical protein
MRLLYFVAVRTLIRLQAATAVVTSPPGAGCEGTSANDHLKARPVAENSQEQYNYAATTQMA